MRTEPKSCSSCHQMFNTTDPGSPQARHSETPWCNRCTNRCQQSTERFHRCDICR